MKNILCFGDSDRLSLEDIHLEWYSISPFITETPSYIYHKENETAEIKRDTIQNLHVLARAHVNVTQDDSLYSYLLRISADDYYKLYINGTFVGQGPAPAYSENYYYNELDVSQYLKGGDNVLAVHLYYQGLINRVWNSGDKRFGIAAELTKFDMEKREEIPLRWRYKKSEAYSGETTGYETQFLENFDSRKWEEDWNQSEYDDRNWKWMEKMTKNFWHFASEPVAMLDIYTKIPMTVEQLTQNHWFIDAGEEITGSLCLKAAGRAGQTIIIRCGEELDRGHVRFQMRCGCVYCETWTLADGLNTLEPYDYKGFRYAELLTEPGVEIISITLQVRHHHMDESLCTFSSSVHYLEDIFKICKNTVKYGTQEGYLDCPTREKGQYLGDAVITSRSQVWLSGDTKMLEKCISQFAQTKGICPGLMGVAPGSFMQEIADFSLLFPLLLKTHYQFSGDRNFLRKYYSVAKGILKYFAKYERDDGLLYQVADKWNLVDWPENLRDNYDFELSRPVVAPGCHNVINALYIGAMKTLAELETILNIEPDTGWKTRQEAYIKAFYRPKLQMFADSENSTHCALHSNLYPLYYGLVPLEACKTVGNMLVKKGFTCGVMLSYFVLKGLAKAGRYEDVFKLLINESEHGWVNMLREGASTCFEAWGKEQKWNTSLCHPWASAPVSILIEDIAGIVPDPEAEWGYSFEPHIPLGVEKFYLTVPFRGKCLSVKKEKGEISFMVF